MTPIPGPAPHTGSGRTSAAPSATGPRRRHRRASRSATAACSASAPTRSPRGSKSAPRGADGVIVQGGINDIAQRYDVGRAAENLRGIVQEAEELGLPVAIADVLPWNNGYPDADPQIRALNLLIDDIAAEEKIPLLPFHDTLEDPDAPGRMAADLTADGDHPSVEGYRLVGERAFKLPQ